MVFDLIWQILLCTEVNPSVSYPPKANFGRSIITLGAAPSAERMTRCRTLLPLLLCVSPAAALQLSAPVPHSTAQRCAPAQLSAAGVSVAVPEVLRAAASLEVEGVTLVPQETAQCILAEWDAGEPARLHSAATRLDGPNTRGPSMMHDSLSALGAIAEGAGVAASLVRLVLHRHDRTLSSRAAAAAEGDYDFVSAYLARPQAVRAYAAALGTSYVSVGLRLRGLVPREERARRSQLTRVDLVSVEAATAVMAAFEASGGDMQAAAAEAGRQLSSRYVT